MASLQHKVGDGAFGSPCDMNVGAIAMPTVVAKLAEMGREIKQNVENAKKDAKKD
jgi:hypothetical protein